LTRIPTQHHETTHDITAANMLTEIDNLQIHVLVNDELDPITPSMNPAVKVASQFMGIPLSPLPPGTQRDGATMEMRMDNICCAAHGLSLLIIATKGDKKHILLFDAGPEGEVWERNSRRSRSDIGQIEHIVLSHYHRDHSGTLESHPIHGSKPSSKANKRRAE
jgi:7,8-dihydropterin-6-yl-methyl-4-(beta-D-ribofuranosyl)aminobenzene 5'-phosphate synthase